MTASDLLKIDAARILRGEKKNEAGIRYNERIINHLIKDYQRLRDAANYSTKVVLLGNNRHFTQSETKRLVGALEVEQLAHADIYSELLFPVINGTYYSDPNLTIEIQYSSAAGLQQLEYEVKAEGLQTQVSLFFVPTDEIGRIMGLYKNSILKYNPRSFLDLENNAVNQEIAKSIKSANGNAFALFNNGVTIISDNLRVTSNTARRGVGQIILTNPQLVNGAQTAYTLSSVYAECARRGNFSVFKGKQVLLRVITFVGRRTDANNRARLTLVGDISRATNSQTKVDESDRRSNDLIQLELQRAFFEQHGLYYERKRGEFHDGLESGYITRQLLVDRKKLVRVALSHRFRPQAAKASIGQFFKPGMLETVLKVKDVDAYTYGYEALKLVESARRQRPIARGDKFNTKKFGQGLRVGQYAIVSACVNQARAAGLSPAVAVDACLDQWLEFESWVAKRRANSAYREDDGRFDFTNYYKGQTVGADVETYGFKFRQQPTRRRA